MCYIFIYVDHKLDLNLYKVIYPILGDFWTHFLPKYSFAVSMVHNEYEIEPNEC